MYCPNCGTNITDDAAFCPECGNALNNNSTVPKSEPVLLNQNGAPLNATGGKKIMILGIIALVLSEFGLPGIILAAIALSNAKSFIQNYGSVWGMAKVGRILAKIALPISIVLTIYYLMLIFVSVLGGFNFGSITYYA